MKTCRHRGVYIRVIDSRNAKEKETKFLQAIRYRDADYKYTAVNKDFFKIPANPIAYWANDRIYKEKQKGEKGWEKSYKLI